MADPNEWQTQACRQRMIDKIESTLKKSGPLSKQNSCELEASVFQNSRNEDEYVDLVCQLIEKMEVAEGNSDRLGLNIRDAAFSLDPDSIHISHGSWGTVPKAVFNRQLHYHEMMESTPDRFFRRYVRQGYLDSCAAAAKFVGADPKNVVLVENTTSGVNIALKCLPLKAGDGILVYSWTYKSISNACLATAHYTGAEVITMDLSTPLTSKEEVVQKYRQCLEKHPNIKVAVIEYISSPTATLFPVKEILEVCQSHDVITIIDGAHSPGQVPLNLESLGCDFFTGNFHKWVFTPRGCSILWVAPMYHSITRPLVTAHCYKSADWRMDFVLQPTRDSTPYLVVCDAIDFYNTIGGMEVIKAYTGSLLDKAVTYMIKELGTSGFPIPRDMEAPYMRLVELPHCDKYKPDVISGVFHDMDLLMDDLWEHSKAEVTCLYVHGRPYIRLSCFVYNHFDDYVRITNAIKTLYAQAPSAKTQAPDPSSKTS